MLKKYVDTLDKKNDQISITQKWLEIATPIVDLNGYLLSTKCDFLPKKNLKLQISNPNFWATPFKFNAKSFLSYF